MRRRRDLHRQRPALPADGKSIEVCRAAAGPCDAPESCDGAGDDCPLDLFMPLTEPCRGAVDASGALVMCTGVDPECPAGVQGDRESDWVEPLQTAWCGPAI